MKDESNIERPSLDWFLFAAVRKGHTEDVGYLLYRGADIQATLPGGLTPLHVATERLDVQMVEFLLESGADPLARTDEGFTPRGTMDIGYAEPDIQRRRMEIRCLLAHDEHKTPWRKDTVIPFPANPDDDEKRS